MLRDRPLSVIRVHRGQEAFMQKNVPKYTPDWVQTVEFWAETSKREVSYALCNDRRTLLWFANQRAVEYHPTLVCAARPDHTTHLVLDLDPPDAGAFGMAARVAHLVRQALADVGLEGAVKTSGAKGVHVFVPIDDAAPLRRLGRGDACHRRAHRGARPVDRHHRVHEGGSRGQGVRRLDPRGRRDGRRGLQPARAARRAGLLPGGMGRARRRRPDRLHRAHRDRAARRPRPVGRRDAGAAGPPRRADRGGQRHPDPPGAGDARGQAACPGEEGDHGQEGGTKKATKKAKKS